MPELPELHLNWCVRLNCRWPKCNFDHPVAHVAQLASLTTAPILCVARRTITVSHNVAVTYHALVHRMGRIGAH